MKRPESACLLQRASGLESQLWVLGEDFFHDFSVDIGQAEIAAEMARGELEVVDAELVQDGRVQVVDVDPARNDSVAHVIGCAKGETALDSTASHPRAEAFRLVFAAVFLDRGGAAEVLTPRRAPEFPAPQDKGVLEQAPGFEVLEQACNGLIGLGAELW